jgi:hypothetical protein
MSVFLRAMEFLGLSIWLGSDGFLSFVVAPGAFSVLASRDQAGAIVGYSLGRMHWMGIVCGVVLMILLTVVSQVAVSPKMAVLRVQMGSIEATGTGSPLLAEFAQLHTVSVVLESGVLLAGMLALFWMVRDAAVVR